MALSSTCPKKEQKLPTVMANMQGCLDADACCLTRMGELEPWIDENFVRSVWYNMGEQVNVKMIRDKFSG